MFGFHTGTSGIASDIVVVGDAADLDNIYDGDGGTVCGWIKFGSYGMAGFGRVYEKGTNRLYCYDTNDRLGFSQNFSVTGGIWTTPTNSLEIDTLYHVSLRYDSDSSANDPKFTIDGIASATTQVTGPSGTRLSDASDRLLVGSNEAYDRAYDGGIADLRFYNRQLLDSELRTIYTARGADPIITGLLRRFPMSPHRHNRGIVNPWIGDTQQSVSNASSITVTTPTDEDGTKPINGDLLVMAVAAGGNSGGTPPNINTPSGWTLEWHVDADSTLSTPAQAFFYKESAGSESDTFSVSSDQTCAYVVHVTCYRGPNTTPDDSDTATGTSDTPQSPTLTAPASPALVIRVCSIDGIHEPTPRGDFFPPGLSGRRVLGDRNSHNGNTLGIGEELRAAEAPGTKDWVPGASDEWITGTISFLYGDGNENLPAIDLSPAQVHGTTWHQIVGLKDSFHTGGH